MSRSGYCDDLDNWDLIRWRGQVASAIRGTRGQTLLKDLLAALDAMPEKSLISGELEQDGEVCALGALGRVRGIDMDFDSTDYDAVASEFNIAHQLAREIMWENDEVYWNETPEHRWQRMRAWVAAQIKQEAR